jgi:hypothetical protein
MCGVSIGSHQASRELKLLNPTDGIINVVVDQPLVIRPGSLSGFA